MAIKNSRKKRQKIANKRFSEKLKLKHVKQKEKAFKDPSEGTPLETFKKVWYQMMTTPIHLDSALSKLTPKKKSIIAQILPRILAQPVSLAEHFGIGVNPGEPWSLSEKERAKWPVAHALADKLIQSLENRIPTPPAIEEDFPPWMKEEFISSFGKDVTQNLIQSLTREPPLSLRVQTQASKAKIFETLRRALPVKTELSTVSPIGIKIQHYTRVMHLEEFKEGQIEIQDEGSQLMALFALNPEAYKNLLQTKPGQNKIYSETHKKELFQKPLIVIDTCAGAGGKTLAMGDLMSGKGRIYAYDIFESKISALRRRAIKAKLQNIQGVLLKENHEAEMMKPFYHSADRVLVDAPCSGFGVLRRNPDAKWRQSLEELSKLPLLQSRLLHLYAPLVKVGGRLCYGLCTFRVQESSEVIEQFLKLHPEFECEAKGYIGPDSSDGFFMASLIKRSDSIL